MLHFRVEWSPSGCPCDVIPSQAGSFPGEPRISVSWYLDIFPLWLSILSRENLPFLPVTCPPTSRDLEGTVSILGIEFCVIPALPVHFIPASCSSSENKPLISVIAERWGKVFGFVLLFLPDCEHCLPTFRSLSQQAGGRATADAPLTFSSLPPLYTIEQENVVIIYPSCRKLKYGYETAGLSLCASGGAGRSVEWDSHMVQQCFWCAWTH